MKKAITVLATLLSLAAAPRCLAADAVKIGLVTTLSGPGGYLGEDFRDGMKLAIQEGAGKLGGVAIELLVEDDAQNPGKARQIVERYLENDKIKIFTGIIYTNLTLAVVPEVLEAGGFYLNANTGPTDFAGKGCKPNYFVIGQQVDSQNYAAGEIANRLGFKRMVLLAPNYQAGRELIAAFKKSFKGDILNEIYSKLDQTDFSAEHAQIRSAKPDGVYQFLPGGLGIASLKQYVQSGLKETIPIIMHAVDGHTLAAVGDAAIGVHAAVDWNNDLDNAASRSFAADFEKTFGRPPTYYAARSYDTGRLIGSALQAVGGDLGKADAFRAALRKADFESVRGFFKFGQNQHPVLDWYMTEVVSGAAGKPEIKTVERVLTRFADPYGVDCKL